MEADNHTTVQVETDDKDVRLNRLQSDLQDCESVDEATIGHCTVKFTTDWYRNSVPPTVLSVLAEHNATLEPTRGRRDYWHIIFYDDTS